MTIQNLLRLMLALVALATPAMAQDDYRIRAGDTLQIEVLEDPSLNRATLVLPDGRISFPFAGTLQASGRTIGQVETSITQAIASNFAAEPNVFVSVTPGQPRATGGGGGGASSLRTIDIFFVGEVNAPGVKAVPPGTTLLQALALSGGFSKFAATKRVQLRRTGKDGVSKVYQINYAALADGARLNQDVVLVDGDVILVPERKLFE
jgi:polysaccharide export outer membrane protein